MVACVESWEEQAGLDPGEPVWSWVCSGTRSKPSTLPRGCLPPFHLSHPYSVELGVSQDASHAALQGAMRTSAFPSAPNLGSH